MARRWSSVAVDSVQVLIAQVPACAVPCLNNAAKQIGCSATDNACKCSATSRRSWRARPPSASRAAVRVGATTGMGLLGAAAIAVVAL